MVEGDDMFGRLRTESRLADLELFADARPSIGYQDERGLSLCVHGPEALEEFQAGNPS